MTHAVGSLKVVHWCPHFAVGGGIASAVLALSRAQRDLGAKTTIVMPSSRRRALFEPDDAVQDDELFRWEPPLSLRLGNMSFHPISQRDVRRIRALAPDVVHVHAEFNPDNLRVARLFDCPLVLSPHGAFHPKVLESSLLRNKIAYAHLAERFLYRRVAAFHALSPRESAQIRRLMPGAQVYCVPQGSTLPPPGATRRPRDEAGAPVQLLFLGRLDVYTKGLDVLLDAFALAARRVPRHELRLRLVGPGTQRVRRSLEERARRLNIAERVDIVGTAPRKEVAALLDTHSVYVQLSRHEGLSASVSEALGAGLPAVLSVDACPFDEIAALEHVSVVEPTAEAAADAVVSTVEDLRRLRAAASRVLPLVHDFFSWRRIAEAHISRYAEVIDPGEPERLEAGVEQRAVVG